MNGIKLRGTGRCVPANTVTNDDLSRLVDTNDEWITARTGIRSRYRCEKETLTELCVSAARDALHMAGITPADIGVCIVATVSADTVVPSAACLLQRALGLPEDTPCFDLNAACTGFVYALHTMECLLNASPRKFGLVVGAEALSRGEPNVLSMEGTQVFKFAVETVPACMDATLKKAGLTPADIDFFVFHQANARIIDLAVRKYRIPPEKYYKNIDRYGNTAAASVPLVLSELVEQGRVGPGSRLLLTAFGGGLTWGGAVLEMA